MLQNSEPADPDATAHDNADFLRRLARLQPGWHHDAACIGVSADVFFPGRGQSSAPAFELCGRCRVRVECLAEAVADPTLDHGIRGGMNVPARQARRRTERPGG